MEKVIVNMNIWQNWKDMSVKTYTSALYVTYAHINMLYQITHSRFIRWYETLPSRFKFKARGWKAQECCFWAMRCVLWIKVSTNIKIVTIKWKNWFTIIVRLTSIVFVKHVHRYKLSGGKLFVGSGWTQRYINWNNDTGKPIVLMTLLQHRQNYLTCVSVRTLLINVTLLLKYIRLLHVSIRNSVHYLALSYRQRIIWYI